MAKSTEKAEAQKDHSNKSATAVKEPPKEAAKPAHAERDPARDSALTRAVQQIEKQFGKGSLMKLDGVIAPIEGIGTGSISLDIALGGAGVPRGRIIEVFGPESSGENDSHPPHHRQRSTRRRGGGIH